MQIILILALSCAFIIASSAQKHGISIVIAILIIAMLVRYVNSKKIGD